MQVDEREAFLLVADRGSLTVAAQELGLTQPGLSRQMQKLENYPLIALSAILAMLPCSPGFLIGLPTGILTLLMLRGPETQAAFTGEPIAQSWGFSSHHQPLPTTTFPGWERPVAKLSPQVGDWPVAEVCRSRPARPGRQLDSELFRDRK